MTAKKILLPALLLLLTASLITAASGRHWWKNSTIKEKKLPDAVAEYRRLIDRSGLADSLLDLSGTIRIYDRENKDALKEERLFHYSRHGRQYAMQLSYLQSFCDGDLTVQLDTVNKSIVVSRSVDAGISGMFPMGRSLESLFSDTAGFRITGDVSEGTGAARVLRMQSDFNPAVRSYKIIYDTLTYHLRQSEIEWWKSGPDADGASSRKIWLARIDYQYHPGTSVNIREKLRTILLVDKGQVKAAPAYRGYQLLVNN